MQQNNRKNEKDFDFILITLCIICNISWLSTMLHFCDFLLVLFLFHGASYFDLKVHMGKSFHLFWMIIIQFLYTTFVYQLTLIWKKT